MSKKRFFCIRGHMKSGTNWICRLLNLHPDIDCQGEYHWHRYFDTYQSNRETFQNLERKESEKPIIRQSLSELVRTSMVEFSEPTAKLIGDRTPHTISPVVIPEAPHISIVRDCRDVLVSKMFHIMNFKNIPRRFLKNEKSKMHWDAFKADPWYFQKFPGRLLSNEKFVRTTCAKWARYIRSDQDTVANQPQLPVMFVQYEKVHEDIYGVLEKMFAFLEVDPALVTSIPPSLMPGHKKETPNQFNRKGEVGDWRNYVNEKVKDWINIEAGAVMMEHGYIQSLDWEVNTLSQSQPAD